MPNDAAPSPLTEADPHSLDELWSRIDRNLVAGLPQNVTDADIDAATVRLRAARDLFMQKAAEEAARPKGTRKKATAQPSPNVEISF